MRKVVVGLVAAALVAGSVVMAVPAHAAALDCIGDYEFPETQTVKIVGLDVIIDPNGIPSDVDLARAWASEVVRIVLCLEGGTVTGPASCLVAKAEEIAASIDPVNGNLRYVTRDPSTGVVTIHGSVLVADLTAC